MPPNLPHGVIEPPRTHQPKRPDHRRHQSRKPLEPREPSFSRTTALEWLEILLDEAFVIPGTGIRFGLDGIIGLVPGLGDVLAGHPLR